MNKKLFVVILVLLAILLVSCDHETGKQVTSGWVWGNGISDFFQWLMCFPGSQVCWR